LTRIVRSPGLESTLWISATTLFRFETLRVVGERGGDEKADGGGTRGMRRNRGCGEIRIRKK